MPQVYLLIGKRGKLAVIYHSETENKKQAAEWIADGMNEVSGVEARAFSIEKVEN